MVSFNSPVFIQLQSHPGVSVGPSSVGVGASPTGVGEGEGSGLGSGLGVGLGLGSGLGDAFWFCSPVEEEFCHNQSYNVPQGSKQEINVPRNQSWCKNI